MPLKEFELLEAVNDYCNGYPSEGRDDSKKLMTVAKGFTKAEIESTIEFIGSTTYDEDVKMKTTLTKLNKAKKK